MEAPQKPLATVLCCMDYRFWEATLQHIKKQYSFEDLDLITFAGGTKFIAEQDSAVLDIAYREITLSHDKHNAQTLFLVNHEDGGAYGGSASFGSLNEEIATYTNDLHTAKKLLSEKYHDMRIICILAKLEHPSDDTHRIIFEEIT